MNLKTNPIYIQVLGVSALVILIVWASLNFSFNDGNAVTSTSSTRTALALTAQLLLGPFPTSTAPSATASTTPSITPTVTRTATRTLSPTPTRFMFASLTPRTAAPGANPTNTVRPTQTATAIPPTKTPVPPTRTATNPPPPTSPPATPTASYP